MAEVEVYGLRLVVEWRVAVVEKLLLTLDQISLGFSGMKGSIILER